MHKLQKFLVVLSLFAMGACSPAVKEEAESTPSSSELPAAPTSIDDGISSMSLSTSPSLQWTGGSGSYEVALGTTPASSNTVHWKAVGNVTNYSFSGVSLSDGTTYYASVRSINSAGLVSAPATSNGWLAGCPENFVRVPALTGYASAEFCVAKYEMKLQYDGALVNDGNEAGSKNFDTDYETLAQRSRYKPVSTSSGRPWVHMKRGNNDTAAGQGAIEACQSLGANYDLITNDQWQAVARNIETVGANWNGGSVGVNSLSRGHSDSSPAMSLAGSVDSDPCFGTGQTCSATIWHSQRRTLELSNGGIVWDFAGNVREWVKTNNLSLYGTDEWTSLVTAVSHTNLGSNGRSAKATFGPAGDYTALNSGEYGSLGYGYWNYGAGAIRRGGFHSVGVGGGIFDVNTGSDASTANNGIGFRCVYRDPSATFSENFNLLDAQNMWFVADNYSNNGVFNCDFAASHAVATGGRLELKLSNTAGGTKPYTCSEIRTHASHGTFHYGRYEVRMKVPAQNNGMLSSFFLFTGSPHDEIDLEFLGKDTTKVQTNYYVNGVGGNELMIDLGFDASAGFHTYAIDWQPTSIKWYVDGVLVRTVTGTTTTLPSHPVQIYANIWNGTGVDSWLNPFVYSAPLLALYDWITFTK